ncbi:McrB family protein [Variovorax sp. PAMC26660]|uniref:McrB family protein n=1 Tax=Variovorax sp. PAMC26660 TaxID=2762322 RepID=UPI00164DFD08|nr:AAA family ATPase [Variovorax sp. PAMC26660]QNK66498.1 AAA family ATPase [Variovorax sp. PAMC26660]
MPTPYFRNEHFELLERWRGTEYDNADAAHQLAYAELCQAYDVTKRWAVALQKQLFPNGWCKTVRKPTDQWKGQFLHYNWGRIYPSGNAPLGLAYTVGIEAEGGFVVKIDVVDSKIKDRSVRKAYEDIRGPFHSSRIVAIKPIAEGLSLDFDKLVAWSAEAVKGFSLSYEALAEKLKLSAVDETNSLLRHFQSHPDFVERQPLWPAATTALFIRVAQAVNELGLDWWFTKTTNSQLRFGRREKNAAKGSPLGSLFLQQTGIRARWDAFAGLDVLEPTPLSHEIVQLLEESDKDAEPWPARLIPSTDREGYWPDDYVIEGDEDVEGDVSVMGPPRNIIYYGPPGTGKTFQLQALLASEYTDGDIQKRYTFVTFHQSYGYEEFVEGLRPVISVSDDAAPAADAESPSPATGEIRYEIKRGAFLRLCELARTRPSERFAIVIDEINRGNISKIFGELITLLEVDKREGALHAAQVMLPYSGTIFSVPSNVDVIGTMNTADRSLALMDTALRRRFEFIESMPNPRVLADVLVAHKGTDISIEQMLIMLNRRIEALYDREHTVGHAYFTALADSPVEQRFYALKAVFKNRIIPLLEEYFFEDWQKIRLVLGDNQKSKAERHLQFVHEVSQETDLLQLFGREHDLEQYATRPRFQLNPDALDHPEAYVGIYAAKRAAATTNE